MNETWKDFLARQGAVYAEGHVRAFAEAASGCRAAHDANVLVDLSGLSLVRASGAGAETFLNGQLTNDIRRVDTAATQLSAWCSPKGRMLVLFRVFRHGDGYLLQLPASLRDETIKRLRMYVLRSKVALEALDDAFITIGVAGPAAASLVRDATGAAPERNDAVVASSRFIVARLPGNHPRFEILATPQEAPNLWNELKRHAVPAGTATWTWHDIVAGIPTVLPETRDAFVPQMANLDLLGAIDFDKGCYTGQEIVARVHYRGRLKQRMYRAHTESPEPPKPADPIYAPNMPGQSTGTVVVAAPSPEGGYDLLAVIHCDSVDKGELYLSQPDGARLRIDPLPYSVGG